MQPARVEVARPAPGERSFLKWAGGKTRYASTLVALAPEFAGTYREPFLGSGAVFFELRPARAVLSDANGELVVCFQQVRRQPAEVMALLDTMPNTAEHFERTRRRDPAELSELERAARVIYLNKTSFRGLWRVNRKGEFNTPYGAYDRPYYNRETLSRAAEALRAAAVVESDFETAVDAAEAGDWIFLDPPYVPLGGWSDFKRYTAGQFGAQDHVRLCAAMRRADRRGVYLMLTNSDTEFVRELFGPQFQTLRLPTRRDINLVGRNRGSWDLVFTNYKLDRAARQTPDSRQSPGMARIGP
ncbi:DNA adenine methylase [Pseudofrankia sp. DC12]|uniref:DNA adenine methylase n=1 Tax=Pseudofrankia sp. DC12 TaxID=683315 RepID=UPI0005F87350|nr:DNA adenine methylase [Pseudofrankia sp. DC12]